MFDFHEKRKIRGVIYSRPVIAVLFGITILISFSVYNRYKVAQEMHVKLEARRMELAELQERADILSKKVEYLEGDRGIEEELRNRFDVVKEGEQVVVILDASKQQSTSEEASQNESDVVNDGDEASEELPWYSFLKFW